jgi:hypothetical protein
LAAGVADRDRVAMTMRHVMFCRIIAAALGVAVGTSMASAAVAADQLAPRPDLDRLIEQLNAGAREADGSVSLDAWIEAGAESDALVVVVEPRGAFKLVADPGITVTPTARRGTEWLVPLPYRYVDPDAQYFTPPASVRLPFRATEDQPLEVLVEYAYCVVDYQCFFGEETLTVTTRYD